MTRARDTGIVRILGPLEALVDGRPAPLRPAQRRLLAILLLEPGAPLDRETLVDRMWGEEPPATARTALNVHLSGLRRTLPGMIRRDDAGYRVELAGFRFDRVEFERSVDLAATAAAGGDPSAVLGSVRRARLLWRGTPYREIEGDPRATSIVARLHQLHDGLGELSARALLDLDRGEEALAELREMVGRQPLHEAWWALLVGSLARLGRSAEALVAFEHARAVLATELGVEPGPELQRLRARILSGETKPDPAGAAPPTNLPLIRTSFVGRERDLERVGSLLATSRLVTILGGPGLGKTRLAVEAGHGARAVGPDGIWFAALAEARSSMDLVAAVAAAARIRTQDLSPSGLAERIASRRIVLVLDTCEHVLDACAELARHVLSRPGPARILATSRRPLGIAGEARLHLDPLALPGAERGPFPAVRASPAVRLFVDRARAADATFELTDRTAPIVTDICRRADGIPLALELAAAWVPGLNLSDVGAMLAGEEPPPGKAADRPSRQRTLPATIEWSIALLGSDDREQLLAISAFRGSFALDDVVGVCGSPADRRRVAARIRRLVDASLLVAERQDDGQVAYRTLAPIREVAREQANGPDRMRVQDRLVDHYLAKAQTLVALGNRAAIDLAAVDADLDNLREAFDLGLVTGRTEAVARAIVGLDGYFRQRFLALEERRWLERCLPGVSSPELRARVLLNTGIAAQATNDLDGALRLMKDAHEAYLAAGDADGRCRTLLALAGLRSNRGEWAGGVEAAQAALAMTSPDDEAARGIAAFYLGTNLAYGGDVQAGVAAIEEAVQLFARCGEPGRVSHAASTLVLLGVLHGDEARATRHVEVSIEQARRSGSPVRLIRALAASAAWEARYGDADAARRALLTVDHEMGTPEANEDLFELLLPAALLVWRCGAWDLLVDVLDMVEARIAATGQGYPAPWRSAVEAWRTDALAAGARGRPDLPVRGEDLVSVRDRVRRFLLGGEGLGMPDVPDQHG